MSSHASDNDNDVFTRTTTIIIFIVYDTLLHTYTIHTLCYEAPLLKSLFSRLFPLVMRIFISGY